MRWTVSACLVLVSATAFAVEPNGADAPWNEVLPSRAWCTVEDNGESVLDQAKIYQFTAEHFVSTQIYTRRGRLPVQLEDVGMWSVDENQLMIQTVGGSGELNVKAVPPVDVSEEAVVKRGLFRGAAFCLQTSSATWSAVHCPCRAVSFEPGFDI